MPLEKFDAPAVKIFCQQNTIVGSCNTIKLYNTLEDQIKRAPAVNQSSMLELQWPGVHLDVSKQVTIIGWAIMDAGHYIYLL